MVVLQVFVPAVISKKQHYYWRFIQLILSNFLRRGTYNEDINFTWTFCTIDEHWCLYQVRNNLTRKLDKFVLKMSETEIPIKFPSSQSRMVSPWLQLKYTSKLHFYSIHLHQNWYASRLHVLHAVHTAFWLHISSLFVRKLRNETFGPRAGLKPLVNCYMQDSYVTLTCDFDWNGFYYVVWV